MAEYRSDPNWSIEELRKRYEAEVSARVNLEFRQNRLEHELSVARERLDTIMRIAAGGSASYGMSAK